MTEETENLVLSILRDMRGELSDIRTEQRAMKVQLDTVADKVDLCTTRDDMNARFDQVADLMTVVVSAQADLTHRVEALEDAQ